VQVVLCVSFSKWKRVVLLILNTPLLLPLCCYHRRIRKAAPPASFPFSFSCPHSLLFFFHRVMRSLVRQRASTAAGLHCGSPFYRFTPAQASKGGLTGLPSRFTSIECHQRWYSTTPVFRKQLPTSTGTSSSSSTAAAGNAAANAANAQRRRKQQTAAVSSRSGASVAAAVEPELESAPTAVDTAVNSNEGPQTAATQHRASKSSSGTHGKPGKRGRRKQQGAAAGLRSSAPAVHPTGTPRKRQSDVSAALPPVEPPAASYVATSEESPLVRAPSSSLRSKKSGKNVRAKRHPASTNAMESAAAADSVIPRVADAAPSAITVARTDAAASQSASSSSFGSATPVYSTHNMLDTTRRTEEQRMAERCSITKLIMVSASVSFLFTALPRSEGQLKMYVRDMNRVHVPVAIAVPSDASSSAGDYSPSSPSLTPALTSKEFHELRQRLCAEQYATNTVFIHVREMEQLVPPLHLQSPPVAGADANTSSAAAAHAQGSGTSASTNSISAGTSSQVGRDGKTRGRRSRRGRADGAAAVATASPPPPPTLLSPVERLLALQEWKKAAARRAKETQARYPIPAHFHAITRVRFHDPHQTDLTVAMGGGWSKSTDSVLRAIVRSMHQEERGGNGEMMGSNSGSNGEWLAEEDEDEDHDSGLPPFPMPDPTYANNEVVTEAAADTPEPEQPAFLASPYAVKPLLTVCASCVPRREAWIGTCSPKPSAAAAAAASMPEGEESPYMVRLLPAVPRFSTRITIMLEHDEMDPADLVSLAEISTTRKPSSAAAAPRASSASPFDSHSDVSVRGGGVDVAGGGAADLANDSLKDEQNGRLARKRPLQLYCLVQDAGEY
jgi:hypothetical protein